MTYTEQIKNLVNQINTSKAHTLALDLVNGTLSADEFSSAMQTRLTRREVAAFNKANQIKVSRGDNPATTAVDHVFNLTALLSL